MAGDSPDAITASSGATVLISWIGTVSSGAAIRISTAESGVDSERAPLG